MGYSRQSGYQIGFGAYSPFKGLALVRTLSKGHENSIHSKWQQSQSHPAAPCRNGRATPVFNNTRVGPVVRLGTKRHCCWNVSPECSCLDGRLAGWKEDERKRTEEEDHACQKQQDDAQRRGPVSQRGQLEALVRDIPRNSLCFPPEPTFLQRGGCVLVEKVRDDEDTERCT